jgi:hypothetical protein
MGSHFSVNERRSMDQAYSAYMLDPSHGWIATHRLPLHSAIFHCKEHRRRTQDIPVAIVPDMHDPTPYLELAEEFA